MKSRRWLAWTAVALVVLLLAAGIVRMLAARKAQQAALAQSVGTQAQAGIELTGGDIVSATRRPLQQGLPLSGTVRALQSAVVKARVAGEVLDLVVREGDTVRAGQVVARIEPTEYNARLRQAQDQAEAARAQIDIAQRQYDNNRALVDQGFISKTALDTSVANLASARANQRAAAAAVDVSRKAAGDTVLRAPIAGQVAQRTVQPGERVNVDARIIEIVDLRQLEIEVAVATGDAIQVRVGQRARLRPDDGNGLDIGARVARINPSVQAGSRSVLVYLALDKPEGLRNGMFLQGQLDTGLATVVAVPAGAVRTDKPMPYVQVLRNQQVVHQPVQTVARGELGGETWYGVEGLAENTPVIRSTVGYLREGTTVRLAAAPASAASAAAPASTASAAR